MDDGCFVLRRFFQKSHSLLGKAFFFFKGNNRRIFIEMTHWVYFFLFASNVLRHSLP